jgi:hypothetical protein
MEITDKIRYVNAGPQIFIIAILITLLKIIIFSVFESNNKKKLKSGDTSYS